MQHTFDRQVQMILNGYIMAKYSLFVTSTGYQNAQHFIIQSAFLFKTTVQ